MIKMATISNDEITQFRIIINELKEIYTTKNLDFQSQELIKTLLNSFRYQIEYILMNKVINELPSIKEVEELIENLNKRILDYKNDIYNNFKQSGEKVFSQVDRIKLLAMENSLRRLTNIKTIIRDKNYNSYIKAMNDQIKSSQELVLVVESVLADGYNDYFSSELIQDGRVNENIMTIIYSIIKDKKLFDELNDYVSSLKEIENLEKSVGEDRIARAMFCKIENYEEDLKRYIVLNTRLSKNKNQLDSLNDAMHTNDKKIASFSEQKYLRFLHGNQIRKLEVENSQMNIESKKINKDQRELDEIYDNLEDLGFKPILDAFSTEVGDAETIYDKFALYAKTQTKLRSIDMATFIKGVDARVSKKEIEINFKKKIIPDKVHRYSSLAQKLIKQYPDDVHKIVDLYSDENDISKLIAFYVLNLLCSAKKFSYDQLKEFQIEGYKYESSLKQLFKELDEEVKEISCSIKNLESEVDLYTKKVG